MNYFIVRIIYLIMLPNGVIAVAPAVDVVFSELPALLFFFIYSLIVIRWYVGPCVNLFQKLPSYN